MDRQGYLEAEQKYAEMKRTIRRNSLRIRQQMRERPMPHYRNSIYNPRNNQINFQVQNLPAIIHHRPAIIYPHNMRHANMHGVHGVHYKLQKPHMRTQDTARFCNSLGYVLPAPKLLTRNAKIASNKQQLEAVKEKSRTSSKLSSNSPSAPSAPSATTKRNSKTNNTPPRNTPKVLQVPTRVMRLSRSTNKRSNV